MSVLHGNDLLHHLHLVLGCSQRVCLLLFLIKYLRLGWLWLTPRPAAVSKEFILGFFFLLVSFLQESKLKLLEVFNNVGEVRFDCGCSDVQAAEPLNDAHIQVQVVIFLLLLS